jgi:hypothetical protein
LSNPWWADTSPEPKEPPTPGSETLTDMALRAANVELGLLEMPAVASCAELMGLRQWPVNCC